MSIDIVMAHLLKRSLDFEEEQMLRHLSVQGIGKINFDLAKGVSPEQTMKELKLVFKAMLRRRDAIVASLSKSVLKILADFSPSEGKNNLFGELTVDEMVFIHDAFHDGSLSKYFGEDGTLLDRFDLEDLAACHRFEKVLADMDMLRSIKACGRFQITHLVPTSLPKNLILMKCAQGALDLSITFIRPMKVQRRRETSLVGETPVVVWFHDFPSLEMPKVSADPSIITVALSKRSSADGSIPKKRVSFAPLDAQGGDGLRFVSSISSSSSSTDSLSSVVSTPRNAFTPTSSIPTLSPSLPPHALPVILLSPPVSPSAGRADPFAMLPPTPMASSTKPQRKLTAKVVHKVIAKMRSAFRLRRRQNE